LQVSIDREEDAPENMYGQPDTEDDADLIDSDLFYDFEDTVMEDDADDDFDILPEDGMDEFDDEI